MVDGVVDLVISYPSLSFDTLQNLVDLDMYLILVGGMSNPINTAPPQMGYRRRIQLLLSNSTSVRTV